MRKGDRTAASDKARLHKLALFVLWLGIFSFRTLSADASEQHLVVFGDSLSDNGNSLELFGLPKAPYGNTYDVTKETFPGRWTDGQNWVDYFPKVARFFGVSVAPTNAYKYLASETVDTGGTNFAVGGALSGDLLEPRIISSNPLVEFPPQIPTYLASGKASADDLFIIFIGGNDFLAKIAPQDTVTHIVNGIDRLRQAGIRSVNVVSLPDISVTPTIITLGVAQAAKLYVATVNAGLKFWTAFYASSHGIDVKFIDINTLLYPLVSNPLLFGFTNSTGAAYNPNLPQSLTPPLNPVGEPDDYVFWDGFHPTTNAHRYVAGFIFISLISSRTFPGATLPLAGLSEMNR
jgi:phospholipase/lecithinase/hemolysin